MNDAVLNYSALRELLARSGFALALPELHGNICGIMCTAGEPATHRWLDDCIVEYAGHDDPALTTELNRALHDVALATSHMLGSDDLGFEPLFPDEDTPLEERVEALALYCHGFLSGLGLDPDGARAALDAKLKEILVDFAELARADLTPDDADDAERADFALAELKEYVRVSVQIVFEELAPVERTTTH